MKQPSHWSKWLKAKLSTGLPVCLMLENSLVCQRWFLIVAVKGSECDKIFRTLSISANDYAATEKGYSEEKGGYREEKRQVLKIDFLSSSGKWQLNFPFNKRSELDCQCCCCKFPPNFSCKFFSIFSLSKSYSPQLEFYWHCTWMKNLSKDFGMCLRYYMSLHVCLLIFKHYYLCPLEAREKKKKHKGGDVLQVSLTKQQWFALLLTTILTLQRWEVPDGEFGRVSSKKCDHPRFRESLKGGFGNWNST